MFTFVSMCFIIFVWFSHFISFIIVNYNLIIISFTFYFPGAGNVQRLCSCGVPVSRRRCETVVCLHFPLAPHISVDNSVKSSYVSCVILSFPVSQVCNVFKCNMSCCSRLMNVCLKIILLYAEMLRWAVKFICCMRSDVHW